MTHSKPKGIPMFELSRLGHRSPKPELLRASRKLMQSWLPCAVFRNMSAALKQAQDSTDYLSKLVSMLWSLFFPISGDTTTLRCNNALRLAIYAQLLERTYNRFSFSENNVVEKTYNCNPCGHASRLMHPR